ncbi:MAG: hypothetical protein LUH15_05920 [Tannerellaceae bacterium]|nr:hypothetical protein [Tannerellaceae bacterium]
MALKVNVNKRKVIAGENEGKEFFFGNVVTDGTMDFNELCATISASCTLTQADVIGVLEALRQVYRSHLLDGDTVHLGDVGTVRLTASSRGGWT